MAKTVAAVASTDTVRMTRHADGLFKKLARALSDLSPISDFSDRSATEDEVSGSAAARRSAFLNGELVEQWFTILSSFESTAIEFLRPSEESIDNFVGIINKLAWPQMNRRRHDLLRKRHAGITQLTLAEARELGELQGALDVRLESYYRGANQRLDMIIAQLEQGSNDGQRDNAAD